MIVYTYLPVEKLKDPITNKITQLYCGIAAKEEDYAASITALLCVDPQDDYTLQEIKTIVGDYREHANWDSELLAQINKQKAEAENAGTVDIN